MIFSNSSFVHTAFAVRDNTVKSLTFRVAELLLIFAIWKLFSLFAALQNRFTSFAIFFDNPIQKAYFVWTRGLSRDALLVSSFTILYTAAQLYGTLLWALDAPGYVIQTRQTPASTISSWLIDTPEYIVSYNVTSRSLNATDTELAEEFSANLFRPGANATLTGSFKQGTPQAILNPAATGEPRIWLDEEGWSVSTDTYSHVATRLGGDGVDDQFSCPYADLVPGRSRFYNCTFDNEWALDMLAKPIGTPLVYYHASQNYVADISPRRSDIWTSIGSLSSAAGRMHMFTVTKERRRHTFVSNAFKASIVSLEGEIPPHEMEDLMRRTAGPIPPDQKESFEQGLAAILKTLTAAQATNQSSVVGIVEGERHQLLENFWELYSSESLPGEVDVRVFRYTGVNITLLRSETIDQAPVPYEPCSSPAFQNEAIGGKVIDTDCIGSARRGLNGTDGWVPSFGQVDSSAVLHITGLDSAPFENSKAAFNPEFQPWLERNIFKMQDLLLSRGYVLGLDPGLVEVQLAVTTPGISYLQIFMVLLAAVFAVVSWGGLVFFASGHWSSSFLVNLVLTTMATKGKAERAFVCEIPEIRLETRDGKTELRTERGVFRHQEDGLPLLEPVLERTASKGGGGQGGKFAEEQVAAEEVAWEDNSRRQDV